MDRNGVHGGLARATKDARRIFEREFCSLLLSQPDRWRNRRVEHITPIDHRHYRERISIQMTIEPALVNEALELAVARLELAGREAEAEGLMAIRDDEARAGEKMRLPVPLLTLPKRVLIAADVEDGAGKRVPLFNRTQNSRISTYYLATRFIAGLPNVTGFGGFPTVIRALTFCMPEGLLHRANFSRSALAGGSPDANALVVAHFLRQHGIPVDLISGDEVLEQVTRFTALISVLSDDAWTEIRLLRDPMSMPLLLLPDHLKLVREDRRDVDMRDVDVAKETERFLLAVNAYGAFLETARAAQTQEFADAIRAMSRLTHTWFAFAPVEVELGVPLLSKVSQTVAIGVRKERGWVNRIISAGLSLVPLRGLRHTYDISLGDAQATHVEVETPDTAAIRLQRRAARVTIGSHRMKGSRRIRRLFGMEYMTPDVVALYTTKSQAELRELTSQAPGFLRRFWLRITFRGGNLSVGATQVARLGVIYRLRAAVATLYLLGAAFAVFVAITLWINSEAFLSAPTSAGVVGSPSGAKSSIPASSIRELPGFIAAFTSFFIALVATRERATLAARALLRIRLMLFGSLIAILAALAVAFTRAFP
jgi:hypothetical protein